MPSLIVETGASNLLGLGVALALRTLEQEARHGHCTRTSGRAPGRSTRATSSGSPTTSSTTSSARARPASCRRASYAARRYVFNGTLACRIIAKLAYWFAWQGKRLDPDRRGLVNRITPLRLPLIRATVYHGSSWVDDKECTVIDYSQDVAGRASMVRDETRLVAPGLHLGVVWLWRRRVAWFSLRAPRY